MTFTYKYGVKFEPPINPATGVPYILWGLGHYEKENGMYAGHPGSLSAPPATRRKYFNIGSNDPTRPFPTAAAVQASLAAIRNPPAGSGPPGAIPCVSLSMVNGENPGIGGEQNGFDVEIAQDPTQEVQTTKPGVSFNDQIDVICAGIALYGGPLFLTIGGECNTNGKYHATVQSGYTKSYFVRAFEYVRSRILAFHGGVGSIIDINPGAGSYELSTTPTPGISGHQIAWVWSVEATGTTGGALSPTWLAAIAPFKPAKALLDWYDIHVFYPELYLTAGQNQYVNIGNFLNMADADGRPTMCGEVGAVGPGIGTNGTIEKDADPDVPTIGTLIWQSASANDGWFKKFFTALNGAWRGKMLKFNFVSRDHTLDTFSNPSDWHSSLLYYTPGAVPDHDDDWNVYVLDQFQNEVRATKYLNANNVNDMVKGLADEPPPPPPPGVVLPVDVSLAKVVPTNGTGPADANMLATFSVPLAVGECNEVGGRPALTLTGGPAIWQARTLAKWPDGTVKWALLRAIANPGTVSTVTVAGSTTAGVSAGSNLIALTSGTLSSGTLTLATTLPGSVAFSATVRCGAAFSLFNGVNIGGTSVASATDGIVGQLADMTTDLFNMGGPATIEENGPAYGVLRIDGKFASGSGDHGVAIAAYVCRFHITAGSPDIRITFTLRNDTLHLNASPETDDNNHLKLGWVELAALIVPGASKNVVCCNAATQTVTPVGGGGQDTDVYCYQKFSDAPTTEVTGGPAYHPHIAKDGGGDFTEQGWNRIHDVGADSVSTNPAIYPEHGYMNLSGATAGCTVAIKHMPFMWPASLGANSDGTLRVGVFTRYLVSGTSPQRYVIPWRMHESRECVFSFHLGPVGGLGATAVPIEVAKRLDYPLYGRFAEDATTKHYHKYDDARVFPYRLTSAAVQTAVYALLDITHTCSVANSALTVTRFRNAADSGGQNNSAFVERRLIDEFLRHGSGGALYRGLDEALYLAEWAIQRSADFDDEDDPGADNELTQAHTSSTFDEVNKEHRYDENVIWAYYLTGDERLMAALIDEADVLKSTSFSTAQARANFQWFRSAALVADFLDEWQPTLATELVAVIRTRLDDMSEDVVDVDVDETGAGWEDDAPGGARGYRANAAENADELMTEWPGTHDALTGDRSKTILRSTVFADIVDEPEQIINRTITIDAGPGSPKTVHVTYYDTSGAIPLVGITPALSVVPTDATTFTVTPEFFCARGFWYARLGPIAFGMVQKYLGTDDAHGLLAKGRKDDLCKWAVNELLAKNTLVDPDAYPDLYNHWMLPYAYQVRLRIPGPPDNDHPGGFQQPNAHCILYVGREGWIDTADVLYLQSSVAHIESFVAKGSISELDASLEYQHFFNLYVDPGDPGDPGGVHHPDPDDTGDPDPSGGPDPPPPPPPPPPGGGVQDPNPGQPPLSDIQLNPHGKANAYIDRLVQKDWTVASLALTTTPILITGHATSLTGLKIDRPGRWKRLIFSANVTAASADGAVDIGLILRKNAASGTGTTCFSIEVDDLTIGTGIGDQSVTVLDASADLFSGTGDRFTLAIFVRSPIGGTCTLTYLNVRLEGELS